MASASLMDQSLHLTIRLQQEEEEKQEEEKFCSTDHDSRAVDKKGSVDDGSGKTGSPQTAHATSKGGGVTLDSQARGQNQRECISPTLIMEVITAEEEETRKGGKEKERELTMSNVSSTCQALKRRSRGKNVPEVSVLPLDLPEEEREVLTTPVKRRTQRKRALPTALSSSEELNSKTLLPFPEKRSNRKRKPTLPSVVEEKASNRVPSISVKRGPGRKLTPIPVKIPPELLKMAKEKLDYRCSVCGKDFPHVYKLKRHELTHTGEKPYCCSICGRGFNQKGNLKTHYKVHTGLKGIEDWADEINPMSSRPPQYPEMLPNESRTESSVRCLECGANYDSLSALQAHHITTHTHTMADANPVVQSELQLHFCHRCGVMFTGKEQLEEHMKSHVKEKPYSCPDCGKKFINERYVQVHQRIHTGEKPFLCSHCGKGYHTASSLKLHEMQHSGERPFACSLCEKTFRINSSLMAHYQTHIKERPFLCSVCGKGYTRAEELKVHYRIHTGERPYQCGECGKSFIYRQGLRQHQRTHTGRRIGPTRQLGRPKKQPRLEN